MERHRQPVSHFYPPISTFSFSFHKFSFRGEGESTPTFLILFQPLLNHHIPLLIPELVVSSNFLPYFLSIFFIDEQFLC